MDWGEASPTRPARIMAIVVEEYISTGCVLVVATRGLHLNVREGLYNHGVSVHEAAQWWECVEINSPLLVT